MSNYLDSDFLAFICIFTAHSFLVNSENSYAFYQNRTILESMEEYKTWLKDKRDFVDEINKK